MRAFPNPQIRDKKIIQITIENVFITNDSPLGDIYKFLF